ncbi:MAG TPA: hypothetical protein EYP22_09990 [Methanosarcinales archaeon]|nr:hypothetical protein [Methanosarcinales archaeon]
MTATITIPIKIKEKLKELSRSKEETFEEIIINALSKTYSILNPEDSVEIHLELCDKYLREAEEFLEKGDQVQASEKGWGAAAQILKAMAAKEGKELRSHCELWEYASNISESLRDEEISILWHSANALHTNFYENWMPLREVRRGVRNVKRFVEKLKRMM